MSKAVINGDNPRGLGVVNNRGSGVLEATLTRLLKYSIEVGSIARNGAQGWILTSAATMGHG